MKADKPKKEKGMEMSETKKELKKVIAEARRVLTKVLKSVEIVYGGKTKEKLQPKNDQFVDDFWVATFEIKDGLEAEKDWPPFSEYSVRQAYGEVANHASMHNLHFDPAKLRLVMTIRANNSQTDNGNHVDKAAENLLKILNSEALKLVVMEYLIYLSAKEVLLNRTSYPV